MEFFLITKDRGGRIMARRLFPVALSIPLILDLAIAAAYQAKVYSAELAIAMFGLLNILVFASLIWWNATYLNRVDMQGQQAQTALQDSELPFRTVFDEMYQFIGLLKLDGTLIEVNQSALDFGGIKRSDVIGKPLWETPWWKISQQTQEQLKNAIAKAAAGELVCYEVNVLGFDNTVATIDFSLKPLRDESGKVVLLIPEGRDISDRKRIEEQLIKERDFSRTLIEACPAYLVMLSADYKILMMNPAMLNALGYTLEEVIGIDYIQTFLPASDRPLLVEIIQELVTLKQPSLHSTRLFTKDGSLLTVQWHRRVVFKENGEVNFFISVGTDITERQVLERELAKQQALLKAFITNAPVGLAILDDELRYVQVNEAIAENNGLSVAEHFGKTVSEVLPKLAPVLEPVFQRILATGEPVLNLEIGGETPKQPGIRRHWITSRFPIPDLDGKPIAVGVVLTEISDRKRVEQALAEQIKLSAFVADVRLALTQNQTLPSILSNCCNTIVRHLDAAFARVWTLNQEDNVLELLASAGMYTHIDGSHSRIAVGQFKIGLIAQERQPHLTNSVLEDPNVSNKDWVKREGMVAFAGYPLIVDNELVGVMAMFSGKALDESTLNALAVVADAIALGIKRKQTEEALFKQKQTLRAIIDNAPIWVWMTDTQGRMILVNKTFCEDVGVPESRWLSARHCSDILSAEESINCLDNDKLVLAQETPYRAQEITRLVDGQLHNVEVIKTKVKDYSGTTIGLVGLGVDITEEKQAQLELQESERQFRKLAQREELLNRIANQIRNSLDLDTILETTVHEVRNLLQVDRASFCWYRTHSDPAAWEAIKEAKTPELPSTLGLYPVTVIGPLSNNFSQGKAVRVDEVQNLTEPTLKELLLGIGYTSLLSLPIQTQSGEIGAVILGHCSGSRPWTDSEVELLEAVAVQLAIAINQAELYAQSRERSKQLEQALHELQQTQAQLVQTEKLSSLGQMVAGVAHEINNPVNFIYGNIQHASSYIQELLNLVKLYQKHYPVPVLPIQDEIEAIELPFLLEDLPKLLSSMKIGATRIRDIVLSLRIFSRLDEADMKEVDIHEGIDSTLMILEHRLKAKANRPAIAVSKDYAAFPLVECYPGQLNQVFMNILSNAIDALEDVIKKESNPSPLICIHTEVDRGKQVLIRITDNGYGIIQDVQNKIFDPFFTTKAVGKGTGLGLSIAHSIIVEKHNGQLKCSSELGKGTEFIIAIPIRQQKH